jgi:diguanylate cyclase (GGDEF)-like protein/PAS domain S-box-containing protein
MNTDLNNEIIVKEKNIKFFMFGLLVNRKWWAVPLLLGLMIISASFYLSYRSISNHSYEVATESARNMFHTIKLTRLWNARHGRVYVPVTDKVQPNPYLGVPDRDVVTDGDLQLTMVNPAYMTRQLAELAQASPAYPILFHITSLKPLRPKNAADEWETAALQQLLKPEINEVSERIRTDDKDVFRFMAALDVESACLKCHEEQGYKLGDQRGGISVTFDSERYFGGDAERINQALFQHSAAFVVFSMILLFFLEHVRSQWLLLSDVEKQQKRVIHERTLELQNTNERLRNENQERQLAEQQYRAVSESVFDAIVSTDSAGFIQSWNKSAERLFGYLADEVVGHNITMIMPRRFHRDHQQAMGRVSMGEPRRYHGPVEAFALHKDGHEFPVEISIGDRQQDDHIIYSAVIRDVSERYKAEQAMQEERAFLQVVIDSISDPVVVIRPNHQVMLKNYAAKTAVGGQGCDNSYCFCTTHGWDKSCDQMGYKCPLQEVSLDKPNSVNLHVLKNELGQKMTVEISASSVWNEEGELQYIVEVTRDISNLLKLTEQLKINEQQMEHLVHHDALTNLPNRVLFLDRLNQAISSAQRNQGKVAILQIDLDMFKKVNDSLGHDSGDLLLNQVAERINQFMRSADTVARIGGDEFVVMLKRVASDDQAALVAQKLITELQRPFDIDDIEIYQTISIGITMFPEDGEDSASLLRNADAAVHRAKEEGRNRFMFYTEDMTQAAYEKVTLEADLRHAIENDALDVFYQPQIEVQSGKVVGVEALVRWQRDGMLVSADQFIPFAEQTGLIVGLGQQVLAKACRQLVRWREAGLVSQQMKMAVNLSARQLEEGNLFDMILKTVADSGIDPNLLELEITESLIMKNPEQSMVLFTQLREKGIELSIDDFGTGYSSLAYIKNLPVNKLKIDRLFVKDLPSSEGDIVIARSIIALGQSLGLKVIAEGVENSDQLDFLINENCDYIQGYYFSKPLPVTEFEAFMRQHNA